MLIAHVKSFKTRDTLRMKYMRAVQQRQASLFHPGFGGKEGGNANGTEIV